MNFNQKAWHLCKKIPKGKVSTYKEIACKLNNKAYRAVGNAMNKNPYSFFSAKKKVPCHRVVCSDGKIGGFSKGTKQKIVLLKKEGIQIKNNRIINFEKVLFRF
jgi:methylated-DNA-[protein]-cysteine S-methyltransferase